MLLFSEPYLRGSYYQVSIKDTKTDERFYRTTGAKTKPEARRIIEEWRVDNDLVLLRTGKKTLRAAFEAYWTSHVRNLSESSQISYEKIYQKLIVRFGNCPIAAIRYEDLEHWLDYVACSSPQRWKRIKATTHNWYVRHLRAWFNWLKRHDWVTRSPCDLLVLLPEERNPIETFSKAEMDAIEETCWILSRAPKKSSNIPKWFYYFLIILRESGLRRTTVMHCEWEHVKPPQGGEAARWNIPSSMMKAYKHPYQMPMTNRCWEALKALHDLRGDRLIRINRKSRKGWWHTPCRHFRTVCNKAGLPPAQRLSTYRKTFITDLLEAGVRPEVVMKYSGHTQVSTVYRYYAAVRDPEVRKALGKISGRHAPAEDAGGPTQEREIEPGPGAERLREIVNLARICRA